LEERSVFGNWWPVSDVSRRAVTFAVRLTPPGRGAVTTILVAGEAAGDIVGRIFRPSSQPRWKQTQPRRIRFGCWGGEQREEIVVAALTSDHVEIHCHGGDAAAGAILSMLAAHGCQELAWRDWLARSHSDPLVVEAAASLSKAQTERTAAILLDQYHGALRRAVEGVLQCLQAGSIGAATAGLDALLAYAPLGLHLTEPWQIVIAGRPNVGKSSLLNALLGYQRAIVHDLPGTTRDVVTAPTALDGWSVELADTAGLRAEGDHLESAGIERMLTNVASADLVLLVGEAGRPWTVDERQIAESSRATLLVVNKCDLVESSDQSISRDAIPVSALTGTGLDVLIETIARRLVPEPPAPGAAVPFSSRQVEALTAARSALEVNNMHVVTAELHRLLGVAASPIAPPS